MPGVFSGTPNLENKRLERQPVILQFKDRDAKASWPRRSDRSRLAPAAAPSLPEPSPSQRPQVNNVPAIKNSGFASSSRQIRLAPGAAARAFAGPKTLQKTGGSGVRRVAAEILFPTVTGLQILSTMFGKFYDVAVGVTDEHGYHVVGETEGTACNFYAHPFQGGYGRFDGLDAQRRMGSPSTSHRRP